MGGVDGLFDRGGSGGATGIPMRVLSDLLFSICLGSFNVRWMGLSKSYTFMSFWAEYVDDKDETLLHGSGVEVLNTFGDVFGELLGDSLYSHSLSITSITPLSGFEIQDLLVTE